MSIINTMDSQANGIIINNKYDNSYLDDSKSFQNNRFLCTDKTCHSFKVILIGDASVGKTSIISQYIRGSFEDKTVTTVTAAASKKTIAVDLSTNAELNIWDTCGEERYRSLTKQIYHNSSGIILIYNINDQQSFKNLSNWLHDISISTDKYAYVILVGNKVDLERKTKKSDVDKFARDNKLPSYEISAKTGMNVQLIFEDLLKGMMVNVKERENDARQENKLTVPRQNTSQRLVEKKVKEQSKKMDREKDVGCC